MIENYFCAFKEKVETGFKSVSLYCIELRRDVAKQERERERERESEMESFSFNLHLIC
jgi:hypothetical protein